MSDTRKIEGAQATIYYEAPAWEGQRTAAVGRFRSESAKAGATLLQQIADEVRGEGYARLLGPMDRNTWHAYRLVSESDGSPAFLMEPTSGPNDREAFAAAGFEVAGRYFSARVPVKAALADARTPDPAIRIEPWDGADPKAYFAEVHALSLNAFRENAFYTPIDRETFLGMYMPFVPMLRRELIFLARDPGGSLVGFLFGLPNYAEGPKPRTAILKTYASVRSGAGRLLAHAFHSSARDLGFETAIHALIREDNASATRSRMLGAEIFRRYELMGARLDC